MIRGDFYLMLISKNHICSCLTKSWKVWISLLIPATKCSTLYATIIRTLEENYNDGYTTGTAYQYSGRFQDMLLAHKIQR